MFPSENSRAINIADDREETKSIVVLDQADQMSDNFIHVRPNHPNFSVPLISREMSMAASIRPNQTPQRPIEERHLEPEQVSAHSTRQMNLTES
jgi:hypothetical protein